MTKKQKGYGSDFTKFDKHVIQPEEYEEAPELTEEALSRGKFFCDNTCSEYVIL